MIPTSPSGKPRVPPGRDDTHGNERSDTIRQDEMANGDPKLGREENETEGSDHGQTGEEASRNVPEKTLTLACSGRREARGNLVGVLQVWVAPPPCGAEACR